MRWNDFFETHRLLSTEYLKHLEPRAHDEKKLRVWHVINARGELFTNSKRAQGSTGSGHAETHPKNCQSIVVPATATDVVYKLLIRV